MPTPNEALSLDLQPRDLALLRGLFESRIMTAAHIAALYFKGKREYTKKRLQKLKAAGFIGERTRRVNEPAIHFLTRKAFVLLERKGHLSRFPKLGVNSFEGRTRVSALTVPHELEVMDVKVAVYSALTATDRFELLEFSTWPVLHQFETLRTRQGSTVLVKPDGFVRIGEPEPGTKGYSYDCFLEVDRSTEVQDTLVNRIGCYLDYYQSGGFAVRNGAAVTDTKAFPFRVLVVLKSAERRNNTAERLLQRTPPILRMAWLTTLAEVTTNPLGQIWIRPAEYREATTGTRFDPDQIPPTKNYHRQPEREAFIESRIKRRGLFER